MSHTLLNVKYSDIKSLKSVLAIYNNLESLACAGNSDAIAIKLDIENMLGEGTSPLTTQKAEIMRLYYIQGYTQLEIARYLDITQEAVSYAINTALKILVKYWVNKGEK